MASGRNARVFGGSASIPALDSKLPRNGGWKFIRNANIQFTTSGLTIPRRIWITVSNMNFNNIKLMSRKYVHYRIIKTVDQTICLTVGFNMFADEWFIIRLKQIARGEAIKITRGVFRKSICFSCLNIKFRPDLWSFGRDRC